MALKRNIKYTMHLRLFLFLIILLVTILLCVLIILLVSGNITAGLKRSEIFIKNEHTLISKKISGNYENIAAETVGFSRSISMSIENHLRKNHMELSDLENNPKLLEEIISDELPEIMLYLHKSKTSGAYIVLDATVNKSLPDSESSKAGIYLKNMEPNIVNSTSPTIYVLRGMASIAYKNYLPLHPLWKMEFDTESAPYYHTPMDNAKNDTSLSNLFYWSEAFSFTNISEKIMMCSAPLIDSEGNTFGVCGFDISSMLFKLSYIPDKSMYNRIFCLISPVENNVLKTDGSLFSGGYSARNLISEKNLEVSSGKKSLYIYKNSTDSFIGYHELLKIYPENSLYANNEWALALMVPQVDVNDFIVKTNLKIVSVCAVFMMLGIISSYILSKYYIIPINKGIDIIKNNPKEKVKTNILEIDELIEFLSNKEIDTEKETDLNSIILKEFLNNFKSLSPAERAVFNLYARQYNAKEISENLYLSINTIKTHTKRIYSKLNITSKEELILYVEMLKESGKDFAQNNF